MPRALRDIHRAFLLQACHRLRIPQDRWPQFSGGLNLMGMGGSISHTFPPFELPVLEELVESVPAWRKKTEKLFRERCNSHAKLVEAQIKRKLEEGSIVRVEQPDEDAIPLTLRYDWAARRLCFNEQFKDMSTKKYSPDTIRKTVSKIRMAAAIEKRRPGG